jgi:hypothetical protein
MRIVIRLPQHPVAVHEALMGLSLVGQPDVSRARGSVWLAMPVADKPEALDQALEALTRINVLLMRAWQARGHRVPSVYELSALRGFRYKPEPRGREWWQTFVDNIGEGSGDCEDLASHQAGYYRVNGLPADAVARRTGRRMYHAVVRHVGGAIEDPSLPLGLAEWRLRRMRRTR